MQVDEIVDQDSLEAYLKDQPRALSGLIAARAALRVLPALVWFFDDKSLEKPAAASAASAVFSVIRADINRLLEHGLPALRDAQLWPEAQPQKLDDLWQDYKSKVLATDPNWQFWINWYDRVLAGDPQN